MNGKLKPYAAGALALAALTLLNLATAGAQEQKAAPAVVRARALTPQERRGRAIYLRGESPSGREIVAVVGEVDLPASTVTCAGCHGARGEGKTEGGVTAGNLTWANLTKSYGHEHPTGRRHGPFDEAAVVRAVREGVDPAKNVMLAAMPRYQMSPEDMADLVAYLKRIEDDHDPGVTDVSVRVGSLLPVGGPLAATGGAMRDVLAAYFNELNAGGGVYGRRVELQFSETGASPAATAANARRLAEEGQVFAFVGGLSAGADRELLAVTQELEVPFVGPSTLLPQSGANRYLFYLLPGMTEQARALANFHAKRRAGVAGKVAVVYEQTEFAAAAAAAAEEQCKKAGCGPVQKLPYEIGNRGAAAALVPGLKANGADAVFLFGAAAESLFIKEAEAAGWRPDLYLLGALTGRDLVATAPAGFRDKIFLAFPTVPADVSEAGAAELRSLAAKYKFEVRHMAAQLAALAAAKLLAEGLKRGGRDISRERLVTALEGLYEYETGLAPRLTFGPNRRVGASGAYVFRVDTERQEFAPAGGWVNAY